MTHENAPQMDQSGSVLSLSPILQNAQTGRWRTEAMRSHATPRLLYISKGQGRITISGLTSGYGPNNLIFIPANTMYGFVVGPTVFGQMLTIPAAMASDWPEESAHLRLRDVIVQKEAQTQFETIEREIKLGTSSHNRAAHYQLGILSVFFERQLGLQDTSAVNAHRDTTAARLVAAYADLVERDFRKGTSVRALAAQLGVTATHLTRCCNQTSGQSALALLHNRIHFEACMMLRETKTPINHIARQLGFRSAAYFTRSFAAKAGMNPRDFREFGATHGSSQGY